MKYKVLYEIRGHKHIATFDNSYDSSIFAEALIKEEKDDKVIIEFKEEND